MSNRKVSHAAIYSCKDIKIQGLPSINSQKPSAAQDPGRLVKSTLTGPKIWLSKFFLTKSKSPKGVKILRVRFVFFKQTAAETTCRGLGLEVLWCHFAHFDFPSGGIESFALSVARFENLLQRGQPVTWELVPSEIRST